MSCTRTFTSLEVSSHFESWSAAALRLSIHITADMITSAVMILTGVLHWENNTSHTHTHTTHTHTHTDKCLHNHHNITTVNSKSKTTYKCELTFTVFAVSFELVVAATFTLVLLVPQIHTPVLTAAVLHGARVHHWKRSHTHTHIHTHTHNACNDQK